MSTALLWGTLRLIGLRVVSKLQEESKWGFGQILPVLLLFLPLWSLYGKVFGKVLLRLTTIPCESGFILIAILKMKELKSR